MSEQKKPEWEEVSKDSMTYRIEVPGGWIYRISSYQGVAAVFVPKIYADDPPAEGK